MIRGVPLLAFVIFCVISPLSAQKCIPSDVQNLIFYANGTLSWTNSPWEECYITHYRITAYLYENDVYEVNVEGTSVELPFITYCDPWVVTVYAVALDTASPGHVMITRKPLPLDADLTLTSLNVTNVDGALRLSWDVKDQQLRGCADRFRITVDDQDSGELTDIFVNDKFLDLGFVSPCVEYEFGVRALFNSRPTQEGPLTAIDYDVPPVKPGAPVLKTVNLGATFINTTWIVESRSVNRCPLRSFYVDGGNYFNFSVPITDTPDRQPVPINLQSLRPNSLYILRTSVGNNAGVSRPAIVGVQTLDLDPSV